MYFKTIFTIFIFVIILQNSYSRPPISGDRFELLSGLRNKKSRGIPGLKHDVSDDFSTGSPSWFLAENYQYIPAGSVVLDVRLREGQNSVFLARKGYRVTGLEKNRSLLKKARLLAKEFGVKINFIQKYINKFKADDNSYDAIISFYFMNRLTIKKMLKWLKPGGILILEGHTVLHKSSKDFDKLPVDYFLKEGELLKLFSKYKILKYEEPIHLKTYTSSIIIQKR